jgi:hypothetical protein
MRSVSERNAAQIPSKVYVAIKALRVRPLHSHLVREWPKIDTKLYKNFAKFSKLEAHFRKLEQQRKAPKHNEALRTACCNDNRSHNNYPKHVKSIDSNDCGPPINW